MVGDIRTSSALASMTESCLSSVCAVAACSEAFAAKTAGFAFVRSGDGAAGRVRFPRVLSLKALKYSPHLDLAAVTLAGVGRRELVCGSSRLATTLCIRAGKVVGPPLVDFRDWRRAATIILDDSVSDLGIRLTLGGCALV